MPWVKTGGASMATRRRRMEKQRHLYLVLDVVVPIRHPQIDLPSDDHDDNGAAPEVPIPSAIYRFEAERGEPVYFAGAFGSKILALQPIYSGMNRKPMDKVRVFDVRERSFMFGPQRWPESASPIYVPVSGRLFALADGSFERLYPPPCDEASWENFLWAWHKLPDLPFHSENVASYAVHPDGRTVFVSIVGGGAAPATLSFDTAEHEIRDGDCRWRQHGMWQLPFTGQAYYDRDLEAWVGLSRDPGTASHLCSCDVVPTDSDDASHQQCPAMKLGKENLFSEVPSERHIGAALVYMGDGNKFCLLECIYIQADDKTGSDDLNEDSIDEVTEEKRRKRCIRLTTFSLRYDKNGDLSTVKQPPASVLQRA